MTAESQKTTVEDRPERHRYEIVVDGNPAGFLRYRREDRHLILEHTEIASEYAGKGLGRTLVGAALDALAEKGQPIRVECEFVQRFIERHSQYSSLVA